MEDVLEDLKQFITSTVQQTETHLREELVATETHLREELVATETHLLDRMDDGFAGAGDVVDVIQSQVTNQEQRLTKLEKRTA
jgi:hypothetical protein